MLTRWLGYALLFSLVMLIGASLVGRAIDNQQDRVIFTRNGVTLDCARIVHGHGHIAYDDCNRVP